MRVLLTMMAAFLALVSSARAAPAPPSALDDFGAVIYRVPVREQVVALTFDDGPRPRSRARSSMCCATRELLRPSS